MKGEEKIKGRREKVAEGQGEERREPFLTSNSGALYQTPESSLNNTQTQNPSSAPPKTFQQILPSSLPPSTIMM
jgi:hypothetical protein